MTNSFLLSNTIEDKIQFNKSVKNLFGYKTGGNAFAYIEVESVKMLNEACFWAKYNKIPYKIVGNGSNILLSDKGYKGLIISLKKLNDICFYKENEVKVMSGASLNSLLNFCLENSLSGLEKLFGIPATIGGAVCMNASAFGVSISDFISVVEILKNGKIIRLNKEDCKFSYRKSRFLFGDEVILSVRFKFNLSSRVDILLYKQMSIICRQNSQPMGRTCGSTFKNPKGKFAGKLIEDALLKGVQIGGAKVSSKHANFILANDDCTSKDVYDLINLIKKEVYKKYKIKLKEEVEFLGEF